MAADNGHPAGANQPDVLSTAAVQEAAPMPDAILPVPNGKSPAFQFYPKDFLSDANVISMDCAARGAYITLLAVCWVEVSLPDDDRVLGRLAGAYPAEWKRIREDVLRCFTLRDGRYYHKRLDLERQKQHDFAEEKREAGRKGADRRWHSHSSANGKPIANDSSSSSSSSASSIKTLGAVAPAGDGALTDEGAQTPTPKPKRPPSTDVSRFLDWWLWGYQQFRGHAYVLNRNKDLPLIAQLIKAYGLARLKQMAMYLWHDEGDEWINKTDRGIGILRTKANLIADWIAQREQKDHRPCPVAPEPEVPDAA